MQRRRANRYPRTWTARSRSKGSDSMASKSNRVRPNQIGRSWGFGRAGRRRATAGDSVRGGAALGSPEIVESDAPGVVSTRVWVGWPLRGTCSSPGRLDGHGEGLSVELDGGGGSARRGLAGAVCSGVSRGYGPSKLAPKRQRGELMLTEGSGRSRAWRKGGRRRETAAGRRWVRGDVDGAQLRVSWVARIDE